MVSRGQRQLSILLIATIAMSWLAVPSSLLAANHSNEFIKQQNPKDLECQAPSQNAFDHNLIINLPSYQSICWIRVNDKELKHQFVIGGKLYHIIYAKRNSNLYAGCQYNTTNVINRMARETQSVYNSCMGVKSLEDNPHFNFFTTEFVTPFSSVNITTRKWDLQSNRIIPNLSTWELSPKNQGTSPNAFHQLNTAKWADTDASYSLIASDKYVYGIHYLISNGNIYQRLMSGPRSNVPKYFSAIQTDIDIRGAQRLLDVKTGQIAQPIQYDHDTMLTKIRDIFSLPKIKSIVLQDDPTAGSSPPKKPPLVEITLVEGNRKATFKMDKNSRAKLSIQGAQNNYFLFQLSTATEDTDPSIIQEFGSEEGAKEVYFAIDMMGNTGFLADDSSKPMSDTGANELNYWLSIGGFNASERTTSVKAKYPSQRIDPIQYKQTITSRVYNEPGTNSICGDVVTFGNTNTGYDGYVEGIPDKGHRECINVSEGGWLHTWGVTDIDLNNSGKDPCIDSFEKTNLVFKMLARPICWFMYAMVGSATWFAGFSIDFLIEAVGLQ